MPARNVLELVQDILTEMGSDEVNSISDTIEATSVANIMRQVYYEIVDEMSLPSTQTLQSLTGLGDTSRPNVMQIPDDASNIKFIKYDVRLNSTDNYNYRDIVYKCPDEFIRFVNGNPSTDTVNYQVVLWTPNVPLVIHKLKGPTYWTSFDDNYVVFDSYDSNVDSTLQSSKSIIISETRPDFFVEDTFIPALPENLENVLYIQTLNRCFADLKATLNAKGEREESRRRVRAMRNKNRHNSHTDRVNYGRK